MNTTISDDSRPRIRVIDSLWTFAIATAFLGPLALPLLWRNPRFGLRTKAFVSIFVILLTVALIFASAEMMQLLLKKIGE